MLRWFDGSSPHALKRYQHFRVMPHEVVADPRWKRPPKAQGKAASRCGTNARHSPPGREPLLDCPEASSKVWAVRKATRSLGEPWKQVGWLLMKARRSERPPLLRAGTFGALLPSFAAAQPPCRWPGCPPTKVPQGRAFRASSARLDLQTHFRGPCNIRAVMLVGSTQSQQVQAL